MKADQLLLATGHNQGLNFNRLLILLASGLLPMLSIAALFSWQTPAFWTISYGWPSIALTVFAYLAVAVISSKLRLLPRAEGLGVIVLNSTLAFLLVIVIVALFRVYYSRTFFVTAYLFSIIWLPLTYHLSARALRLTLALVPSGLCQSLLKLPETEWIWLEGPSRPTRCDGVVVDLHQKMAPEWVRFLSNCSLKRIPVYHAAVVYEAARGRVSLTHLSEGLLDDFTTEPFYIFYKRAVDVVIIFLAGPIIVFIGFVLGIAIRLDSSGPVLFWQERMGQHGKPFRMYKFRSMRLDAEKDGACFADNNDPRITRVGKLIRKCRLDELPQLWNVFKGEMSLVGPRPEQLSFARQFEREIPYYSYRHVVKPGITGWAQVEQGYVDGAEATKAKLEFDLYYVKYLSFWLDILIIMKTFRTIITGFGAR